MNYIGTLRQPRNLSTRAHIRHEVKAWINLVAKSEGSMLGLKNEECQRTFFVWTFYVAPWNHSTASESSCNALLIQCNKTHLVMEIASIDSIAVGKNEAQLGGCLLIPSPPPLSIQGPLMHSAHSRCWVYLLWRNKAVLCVILICRNWPALKFT